VTHEASDEDHPRSPRDGRFIYFTSDRSGRWQIWKMPADSGPAVQVTRGGGFSAQESWDARHLYYSKLPRDRAFSVVGGGVWRVPVEGGEETPVVARPSPGRSPGPGSTGPPTRAGGTGATRSTFFDFESGRTETIFRTQGPFNGLWLAGLARREVASLQRSPLHAVRADASREFPLGNREVGPQGKLRPCGQHAAPGCLHHRWSLPVVAGTGSRDSQPREYCPGSWPSRPVNQQGRQNSVTRTVGRGNPMVSVCSYSFVNRPMRMGYVA